MNIFGRINQKLVTVFAFETEYRDGRKIYFSL